MGFYSELKFFHFLCKLCTMIFFASKNNMETQKPVNAGYTLAIFSSSHTLSYISSIEPEPPNANRAFNNGFINESNVGILIFICVPYCSVLSSLINECY